MLPPLAVDAVSSDAATDDWSRLPALVANTGQKITASGGGQIDDPANGGAGREPEHPDQEEIAPERAKGAAEFAFGDHEPDVAAARALRQQAGGLARQAVTDPGPA